jgi:hypothetical protein
MTDEKDQKSDSDPLSTAKEATEEAAKEYTKDSSEAAKQYAEESAEATRKFTEQSVETTKKFTESSMEATRHFAEKAREIGGKTPEIASHVLEQSTRITRDVFGKIHDGWSTAYDTSSKFMQEAYHTTSAYAERHKSTVVMKKLTAEREKLNQKLGSVIYTKYKDESVPPQEIFELQEIRDILDQCENVDNEVLRIGKELDKK